MMAPSDIVRYTCVVQERQKKEELVIKVALIYVPEMLKRSVVVERWEGWESEHVGLTTLVQSPDVITLISWS